MREVDHLRKELERLDKLDLAKQELVSITKFSRMRYAFFPGGNGVYKGVDAREFPQFGTLILGSNYGCVNGFVEHNELLGTNELLCTDERCGPTWVGLRRILRATGIERDACFFTNAWPFLHLKDGNLSGLVNRWLRDSELMRGCIEFFKETLITMQPRLIVALGAGPAAFLERVWPEKLGPWREPKFKDHIDRLPSEIVEFGSRHIGCVAISHPSMPNNSKHRRPPYNTSQGEIELLKKVAQSAAVVSK